MAFGRQRELPLKINQCVDTLVSPDNAARRRQPQLSSHRGVQVCQPIADLEFGQLARSCARTTAIPVNAVTAERPGGIAGMEPAFLDTHSIGLDPISLAATARRNAGATGRSMSEP